MPTASGFGSIPLDIVICILVPNVLDEGSPSDVLSLKHTCRHFFYALDVTTYRHIKLLSRDGAVACLSEVQSRRLYGYIVALWLAFDVREGVTWDQLKPCLPLLASLQRLHVSYSHSDRKALNRWAVHLAGVALPPSLDRVHFMHLDDVPLVSVPELFAGSLCQLSRQRVPSSDDESSENHMSSEEQLLEYATLGYAARMLGSSDSEGDGDENSGDYASEAYMVVRGPWTSPRWGGITGCIPISPRLLSNYQRVHLLAPRHLHPARGTTQVDITPSSSFELAGHLSGSTVKFIVILIFVPATGGILCR
ncbi:hypothetical protein DXG01_012869 [Tephrocybe rancida]|nr:hypothetical protein DXG01_012869 [Tephrocybe rancida]